MTSLAPTLVASEDLGELSEQDFKFFRDLISSLAGISMNDRKTDLVKSRLRSYIQGKGMRSYREYRDYLSNTTPDDHEIQGFINQLTTNKTEFFREPRHFEYLTRVLIPDWVKSGKEKVRIWCCAASTGQEPYTLALVLNEHLPKAIPFEILATDIDTDVLSRAKNGVYRLEELTSIPEPYRRSHLIMGSGKAAGWFKVGDEIHDKIRFEKHNLIDSVRPGSQPFELIFCRNVLIYFSQKTIRTLTAKFHSSLQTDGTLIIGHSESIQGCDRYFKTLQPSVFKRTDHRTGTES